MREILFRGKRKDTREWVYGYYVREEILVLDTVSHLIVSCDKEWDVRERKTYVVDGETICEWTGLYDKTGERIFEGDIIRPFFGKPIEVRFGKYTDDKMHSTYFDRGHMGFYANYDIKDLCYYADECKVIGNVFDNALLLIPKAEI